jgi:hypothetical protein
MVTTSEYRYLRLPELESVTRKTFQDSSAFVEQKGPGRRDIQGLVPAVKQRHLSALLEAGQSMADSGLGEVWQLGRTSRRACGDHGAEDVEVVNFQRSTTWHAFGEGALHLAGALK